MTNRSELLAAVMFLETTVQAGVDASVDALEAMINAALPSLDIIRNASIGETQVAVEDASRALQAIMSFRKLQKFYERAKARRNETTN